MKKIRKYVVTEDNDFEPNKDDIIFVQHYIVAATNYLEIWCIEES